MKSAYSALFEALSPVAIDNMLKALDGAGYKIVPKKLTPDMDKFAHQFPISYGSQEIWDGFLQRAPEVKP